LRTILNEGQFLTEDHIKCVDSYLIMEFNGGPYKKTYRVTHKVEYFRDNCTEFILSVSSYSRFSSTVTDLTVTLPNHQIDIK